MAKIDKEFFDINEGIKANKIEDLLSEDEEVLLRLKPDKKDYIMESIFKGLPVVLIWGGFDAFFIYMLVSSGALNEMGFMALFIIGFFLIHLFPVWMYVANIVRKVASYKNIEYVFTEKRIIIRTGVIVDYKMLYYADISSVVVKVGLWDRMFKVGDLYITTVNQNAVLEDIHSPYQYADKIQEIVRDLKADMEFPNDLRPEENHGYNTKYKK